jgi:hypothetical protein
LFSNNRKESFVNYKKNNWYEKYKIIFPIHRNKEFKLIYDKLGQIKKKYRNPLTHGLTGDYSLLLPTPNSGLIPISYDYLSNNVAFIFNEISYENAKEIEELFEKFLQLLNKEDPFKYYTLFLQFGFPIPVNKNEIGEIKDKMNTYEDFKEELIDRARYEDLIRNRDI